MSATKGHGKSEEGDGRQGKPSICSLAGRHDDRADFESVQVINIKMTTSRQK